MAHPPLTAWSAAVAFRNSIPLAAAVLGLLAVAPGALAQSTSTDPTRAPRVDAAEGFGTTEAGGLFGETGSPFDLIHRAVLMNGTSLEDYSRQQQGQLSDEAASFRQRQQEALRQQQAQPTSPESAAPVAE